MASSDEFFRVIVETIIRTYPENDPRARARRFFPLLARIGYFGMAALLLTGAAFLSIYTFPYQGLVCIIYGLLMIPAMGLGCLLISDTLYRNIVLFMRIKDKRFGKPK